MDTATRVEIQNEVIYISHNANTLQKSMNPTNLHSTMCE